MSRVKKLIIAAALVAISEPITMVCAMNDGSVPEEEAKEGAAATLVMTPEEIAEHNRLVDFMRPRVAPVGEFLPCIAPVGELLPWSLVDIVSEYAMPTREEVTKANDKLLAAVYDCNLKVATSALVDEGASLHAMGKYNDTPLHMTNNYEEGTYGVASYRYIMCTFNEKAYRGRTRINIAKMFLEKKADVNAVNNKGKTSLHLAAENGDNLAMVRLLLGAGSVIDAVDYAGHTPLFWAVIHKVRPQQFDLVKMLI
jgi:hypothetical protein